MRDFSRALKYVHLYSHDNQARQGVTFYMIFSLSLTQFIFKLPCEYTVYVSIVTSWRKGGNLIARPSAPLLVNCKMKVTAASFSLEASRTISSQNRPEMQASFPSSSPSLSLSLSLRRPLQLSRVLDQRVERRLTKIGVKGCQSGPASWHPFFFFSCATSRPRKQRKGISPSPYGKTDSGNIARNNSNWCARAERDWPIFFNFEDLAKKDCKHVSSFYLIASGEEAHLVKSDTQVHKWSAYCVNTLPKRFSLYC